MKRLHRIVLSIAAALPLSLPATGFGQSGGSAGGSAGGASGSTGGTGGVGSTGSTGATGSGASGASGIGRPTGALDVPGTAGDINRGRSGMDTDSSMSGTSGTSGTLGTQNDTLDPTPSPAQKSRQKSGAQAPRAPSGLEPGNDLGTVNDSQTGSGSTRKSDPSLSNPR